MLSLVYADDRNEAVASLLASKRISKADLFKIKIVCAKFVISLWIQVLMYSDILINFMLFLFEDAAIFRRSRNRVFPTSKDFDT